MGIIGPRPETGVRIELERPLEGGPPWRYDGQAVTPTQRFDVAVVVSLDGDVAVELPEDAPEGLAARVRLVLRAAWKNAEQERPAPPRRIVRWRAER
jgi:hypothetical protein